MNKLLHASLDGDVLFISSAVQSECRSVLQHFLSSGDVNAENCGQQQLQDSLLTWKYMTTAKTKTVAMRFMRLGRFCL